MMKRSTLTLIFSGLYYPNIAWPADYPLEFADFFEERLETIELVIAGETRTQAINGLVSYDTFRLTNTPDNIDLFTGYLKSQRVTDPATAKIVTQLIAGVSANPGCEGVLSLCIPKDVPGAAEFVFDFDAQQLKVFVGSDMLARQSGSAEYYSPARSSNALVNWSDLYFYVDGEGSDSLNWSNNTTLGLPLGFLSLETQYLHRDGELELYQALYDVEMDERRAVIGYQAQQAISFNATDFLSYGANYAGVGLSFGSSQNLLKGQKQAQKRIYFFAPQSGQLEVYQGERLLLNKVVLQGQQSLGYDELPSGVYNITLVVKQGEQEILREQRQIVNTSQFSLPVGQWDYRLDAGLLNDLAISGSSSLAQIPPGERRYGRAAFAYRPSETWLFAAGIASNLDDTVLQTGGYWVYGNRLSAQYNLGVFASGSQSHYGQVSFGPVSSSYRYVESDENASALTRLLYGDSASTDWNLGLSGNVLGGTGYLNYFKYKTKDSQSDNISLSWSREAFGGRFSINTTYSIGEQTNNWNTTLAWTISLSDNLSARTGFYVNQEGLASNENSVTHQRSGDYGYASSTLGFKRDRRSEAEFSANITGYRDEVAYSAYTYLNTNGQGSLSGNLSGTQILSAQGAAMTYEKGRAFVKIEPEFSEDETTPIDITYSVSKAGKYGYRDKIGLNESKLLKLSTYTDIAFTLDADGDNVDIENGQYKQFVMPGYYYQLNSKIIPLMSQVFLLNDIFGAPISSALCFGSGCKSVETLSDDGVVRVNYRKNLPFKLISDKRVCLYNPELMGDLYIQAYCLPGLEDDNNIVLEDNKGLITPSDAERALLYIGKYESRVEAEKILLRLQEVALAPKSIKVGDKLYVYVRYLKQYSLAQRNVLESLDAYAALDTYAVLDLDSIN